MQGNNIKVSIGRFLGRVIFVASCVGMAFGLAFLYGVKIDTARANPSVIEIKTNATSTINSLATTTANAPFLYDGSATSTVSFVPENGDIIQVSFAVYSTTTPPTIHYTLETSNNNVDWYGNQVVAAANPASLATGNVPNFWKWTAATTTADETVFVSHVISSNFAAKYGRLSFRPTFTTKTPISAAVIHAEVAVKKQY